MNVASLNGLQNVLVSDTIGFQMRTERVSPESVAIKWCGLPGKTWIKPGGEIKSVPVGKWAEKVASIVPGEDLSKEEVVEAEILECFEGFGKSEIILLCVENGIPLFRVVARGGHRKGEDRLFWLINGKK